MGGLRFSWLQGFGFSFFALLAACGGRSSTLDPDGVYLEPSRPSGGSTSQPAGGSGAKAGVGAGGATSTGGKSGVPTPAGGSSASGGTAGAGVGTSTGSAGASGTASGGSAGLDPTTFAYCTAFCNVSTQGACPSGTTSAECSAQCASELAGESPECRQIASSFLACLTTAYEKSRNCTEVDQSSVDACSGPNAPTRVLQLGQQQQRQVQLGREVRDRRVLQRVLLPDRQRTEQLHVQCKPAQRQRHRRQLRPERNHDVRVLRQLGRLRVSANRRQIARKSCGAGHSSETGA